LRNGENNSKFSASVSAKQYVFQKKGFKVMSRHYLIDVLMFLVIFIVSGCDSVVTSGPSDGDGSECTEDKDCEIDQTCQNGTCIEENTTDGDKDNDSSDGDADADKDPITDGDNEVDDINPDGDETETDAEADAEPEVGCDCSPTDECCTDGCNFDVDGTACNEDNNLCTGTSECQIGVCTEVKPAVVCEALSPCHSAGECKPETGECTNPEKAEFEQCGLCSWCESGDCVDVPVNSNQDPFDDCESCQVCGGNNSCRNADNNTDPKDECTASECMVDMCNEGTCFKNEHESCGLACQWCESGTCINVPSEENQDPGDDCSLCQVCNGTGSCRHADDDSDPKEECTAATCIRDTCLAGSCNEMDGNSCGTDDQCVAGTCEDCLDDSGCIDLDYIGNEEQCTDRVCNESNTCELSFKDTSASCDDNDSCTGPDSCNSAGFCTADPIPNDCEPMKCGMESDSGCYTCTCKEGDTCDEETGNCITENFVPITTGTFWMGSPGGEENCPADYPPGDCTAEIGRDDHEKLHKVTLTFDFEMMKYEATNQNWFDVYGSVPSRRAGMNYPLNSVTISEAMVYANYLSEQAGLLPCYILSDCIREDEFGVGFEYPLSSGYGYNCDVSLNGVKKPQECRGYRIPTEAEWEYAIRSGNEYTPFYQSEGNDGTIVSQFCNNANMDKIGYYCGNSDYLCRYVGQKAPNALGLYDMSGNINEMVWGNFCTDYDVYEQIDPDGHECDENDHIICRGGYFNAYAKTCRSAYRDHAVRSFRSDNLGFRLVRTLHHD